MARMTRKYVVDESEVGVYHCINRCVRRAFLCGNDPVSGQGFDHRMQFIQDRLQFLAGLVGVNVMALAVMSSHLQLVLRNRPDVMAGWSDMEFARRWRMLFPARRDDSGQPEEPRKSDLSMIAGDAVKLADIRKRLSYIGWFMRCVTEPVARRATAKTNARASSGNWPLQMPSAAG